MDGLSNKEKSREMYSPRPAQAEHLLCTPPPPTTRIDPRLPACTIHYLFTHAIRGLQRAAVQIPVELCEFWPNLVIKSCKAIPRNHLSRLGDLFHSIFPVVQKKEVAYLIAHNEHSKTVSARLWSCSWIERCWCMMGSTIEYSPERKQASLAY